MAPAGTPPGGSAPRTTTQRDDTMHTTHRTPPTTPRRAIVRQGDVLLVPVDRVPAGCTARARDEGRVILAYGEVTGHAHQIDAPDACGAALLDPPTSPDTDTNDEAGLAYLTLDAVSHLLHDEHGTIELAPGTYKVVRQREYTPEAIRLVVD